MTDPFQFDTALVLFSGGQDSTVCLAWALARFARVETIGFHYGQRHAVELDVRPRIRDHLAALDADWKARLGDDHLIRLGALAAVSDSALTRDKAIEMGADDYVEKPVDPDVLLQTVEQTAIHAA